MPILVLHYRNNGSAIQKLRMSSLSIPIQKLTLVSLNREITIHIKKYDDVTKNIVDMDTTAKNTGECQIDHLLLYFSYDFNGNF